MKFTVIGALIAGTLFLAGVIMSDVCAGGGCCCEIADGSTCCTYDLLCTGCPCIF